MRNPWERTLSLRFQSREQVISFREARLVVEALTSRGPVAAAETALAAMRLRDAPERRRRSLALRAGEAWEIVALLDRVEHDGRLTAGLHDLQLMLRATLARDEAYGGPASRSSPWSERHESSIHM